jgi:hypothetical protein
MITLHQLVDRLATVECEDLRVVLLLIHPEDLPVIADNADYTSFARIEPREEWAGALVGSIWGVNVVTTKAVFPGCPDLIPAAGGVTGIIESLRLVRAELHKHFPPPPLPDHFLRLSLSEIRMKVKTSFQKKVIKLLGIPEFRGPSGVK